MGKSKGKKKGANGEDSNFNANDIPASCREIVERIHEIFGALTLQEIYATLVFCNMKEELAIERILSQVKSNQDEKKETTDTSNSCSQGVDSSIQNSELGDGGGHDGDQGGENKLHSDETSNERRITNQLADLSTTSSILGPYKSDLTDVEITRVPIRSAKAVRPPTRMVSTSGSTYVDVLKSGLRLSSKENVTKAPVKDDSPSHEKPIATNPSFYAITESASAPYPKFPDDEDVTNPEHHLYKMYAALIDQFQESASVSNQNNLPMQNLHTFHDVMHQQPCTGGPYPLYSTFPWNQSMPTRQSNPTASSLGRRPSVSMFEAFINSTDFKPQRNQQDKNYNYSQPKVLSGSYGNMMNSPCWRPKQNDSYNMPPSPAFQQRGGSNNNTLGPEGYMMNSPYPQPEQNNSYNHMPPSPAFQQLGGSNNNTYLHQSLDSVLPQYRNSNLPQSATSIGPSAHGSAYGSAHYTSSDNAANPRFGYEDVSSILLPSAQHQSVNSNVWPVQGESPHWRSPSFGQSQQVQQPYRGIGNERSSAYNTSQNQQQNRSDPSDQTQQRLWRRDNN